MILIYKRFFNSNNTTVGSLHKISFYPVLLFACIYLYSCHSSSKPDAAMAAGKANFIKLPMEGQVDAAEKIRLHNACQHWYDSVLKNSAFNGGMIVAKHGQIIFEKYRGLIKNGAPDSVNAATVFHIASVSKTFTAMAVLKLWQDGKLQLDDEFVKYFPAFNYPGVTIRNLLSHRSGLPNYLYFMEKLKWNDSIAIKNEDVLQALINHKAELEDVSAPNTHFTYCNTNFALLALLIEKISGISYPQFIQQNFFTPLRMTNSFVFTPADSSRASPNYDFRGQLIKNNYLDLVYGDKNIYTTPRDLLIWDRALSSNVIFKPETLAAAYQPYSNERPGVKNYGLGWRMNNYPNGKKVIFHNGWWHGNNAAFVRLFDEDVTIIVMGNHFTYAIYKAYKLINTFGNYTEVLDEVE